MAFPHRKLALEINPSKKSQFVLCSNPCDKPCFSGCESSSPHNDPGPPPVDAQGNHHRPKTLVLVFSSLGGAFLLLFFIAFIRYYWNNSRRRNPPLDDTSDQDFVDQNHGPVVDHPIWLIRTVGLQQSVIDSISVVKYKKGEGLIEGIDCSVCLNEFQEDENLRLLPKCSHAFHIPCIDTWLRSHKNCPSCRAPVVCESIDAQVNGAETNSSEMGSGEDIQVANSEESRNGAEEAFDRSGEIRDSAAENLGTLPAENGAIAKILERNLLFFDARNGEARVLSDLGGHNMTMEEVLQPVRRSVSVDSSTAWMIHFAVANIRPAENEGCSGNGQLQQLKKLNAGIDNKRGIRNSSMHRLIKSSSSSRHSLQKLPVSMKRSLSSGRKCSWARYTRSQDSALFL